MGGPDINYPEQPSYGEGLADALKAQVALLRGEGDFEGTGGLAGLAPLEREARLAYADIEPDVTARTLLGEITRAGEGGRYVSGQRFVGEGGIEAEDATQVTSEKDQLTFYGYKNPALKEAWETGVSPEPGDTTSAPEIARLKAAGKSFEDFAKWHRNQAASGKWGQAKQAMALDIPAIGEYYSPSQVDPEVQGSGRLTSEDMYSIAAGGEGAIVDRSGGLLDLYGGTTKVRQYDPETGKVEYGTAGFEESTGEFQGLVPMQAQAQGYLSTLQREADVADVERLGSRATEAIRAQGDIEGALTKLGTLQRLGERSTFGVRNALMGEAQLALGNGLSDREKAQIEQASRSAGVAAGRVRDIGRVTGEATALAEGDRQRRLQNIGLAQQLLGGEMGMQQQEFGKALQRLGAEQATAADPMMAILGRPSSAAPGAQSLLGSGAAMAQGAGPQFLNPEAGLGYIQNQATNQANVAMAQLSADAEKKSGMMGMLGSIAAAPMTGGTSLIGKAFGG